MIVFKLNDQLNCDDSIDSKNLVILEDKLRKQSEILIPKEEDGPDDIRNVFRMNCNNSLLKPEMFLNRWKDPFIITIFKEDYYAV